MKHLTRLAPLDHCNPPALIAACGNMATAWTEVPKQRLPTLDRAWLDGARLSCPGVSVDSFSVLELAEELTLRWPGCKTAAVVAVRCTADLAVLEIMPSQVAGIFVDAFGLAAIDQPEFLAAMGPVAELVVVGPLDRAVLEACGARELGAFSSQTIGVWALGESIVVTPSERASVESLWSGGGDVGAWVQAWEIGLRSPCFVDSEQLDVAHMFWFRWKSRLCRLSPRLRRLFNAGSRHGGLVRAILFFTKVRVSRLLGLPQKAMELP